MVSSTNIRDDAEVDTTERSKARSVERADFPHYESMGISKFIKFKANYPEYGSVKFR